MTNITEGHNWAVHKGLINAELATTSAYEADALCDFYPDIVSPTVIKNPENSGLEIFAVDVKQLRAESKELQAGMPSFPIASLAVVSTFKSLLNTHAIASELVRSFVPKFYINRYKEGGQTSVHPDAYPGDTASVSLIGNALLHITDPRTGKTHTFELNPGDAFTIANPPNMLERPVHQVVNGTDSPRIALVK